MRGALVSLSGAAFVASVGAIAVACSVGRFWVAATGESAPGVELCSSTFCVAAEKEEYSPTLMESRSPKVQQATGPAPLLGLRSECANLIETCGTAQTQH